jgi:MFS family permease
MGIATFVVGLLPTYQQVGIAAPVLLAVTRFTQGFALGGEWSGAALLATETAEPDKRARAAIWPQMGAPFGFLLANGLFLILIGWLGHSTAGTDTAGPFLTWGWRIPFLLSAVMVAIGLYVRLRLAETPVFARALARGERVRTPLTTVFRTSWRELIIGTFVMLVTYTLFYIVTTWVLSYGTTKRPPAGTGLGYGYVNFLHLQLIAVLFFAVTVPIAGALADRFGRRRTLLIVTAMIILYGASFDLLLAPGHATTASTLLFLVIGMTLMGLSYGPMSALLPELFPTNVRYTGAGLSFNAAGILGGAVAPFIATWLATEYGVGWVGLYLVVAAILTFVALLVMRETKDISLDGRGQLPAPPRDGN